MVKYLLNAVTEKSDCMMQFQKQAHPVFRRPLRSKCECNYKIKRLDEKKTAQRNHTWPETCRTQVETR